MKLDAEALDAAEAAYVVASKAGVGDCPMVAFIIGYLTKRKEQGYTLERRCTCGLPRRAIVPEEHDETCPVVARDSIPRKEDGSPDWDDIHQLYRSGAHRSTLREFYNAGRRDMYEEVMGRGFDSRPPSQHKEED